MALILAAAASLYGCSRDGKVISDPEGAAAGTQKNQALGRYAESEVPLPEGVTYDSGLGFLEGPDGRPVLFARKEKNGTAEFTAYLLSEDLTWEEKECGWLNQLGLKYENSSIGITFGEDHNMYAVYSEGDDQEVISRHHVVAAGDWEHGQELNLPVMLETCEYGYKYYPRSITALENGNLLFSSGNNIYLYDAAGQQKLAELPGSDSCYFARGSQFYAIDEASESLILYDGEDGKEKTRYPLNLNQYFGVPGIVGENGDISLLSVEGIQVLKNGSGIWEQIIEGKSNTMGSPKYYASGFAAGSQEDYFVYYNSMDETNKLSHYVYYPDMPVEPEKELTIFSLSDNNTIRQAVSEYQIENPNVKVDFQPLLEEGSAAVADDYIRTLNAELLAGEGPDILILDGLSEESYIEKGVLADITDEIERLTASGDFLANIAEECRVDGRIYSVPVRIGLPMTFGRKEALKEAGQLSSLADYVQAHESGQVFGTVDREALLSFYADAFLNDIVKEGDVVEETELTEFLTDMKRMIDGSEVSDGTREKRPSSIWGLMEKGTQLYSNENNGFFEYGQGASIIEQAQGKLEADVILINETYVPYGTIGITKASKNQDLAIGFLQTVLSEDVQRSDFYDGFAVNQNALEFLCTVERTSADAYGGTIPGADGRTYDMKIGWPSEPLRRRITEFCKTVKHSAGRNWKVKQILLEYSKDYFDGTASLEDAAKKLMTKITLYLQE